MPIVIGNSRRHGAPGSSRSIRSNGVFSASSRGLRLNNYDYNGSNLSILSSSSSSNSFVDDAGVSDSIVLDTGGYYFYRATSQEMLKYGGRTKDILERAANDVEEPSTNDSIVEDLRELNTATASGERFVFVSHGDYHQRFVRELCVQMCREGGLRCYMDSVLAIPRATKSKARLLNLLNTKLHMLVDVVFKTVRVVKNVASDGRFAPRFYSFAQLTEQALPLTLGAANSGKILLAEIEIF